MPQMYLDINRIFIISCGLMVCNLHVSVYRPGLGGSQRVYVLNRYTKPPSAKVVDYALLVLPLDRCYLCSCNI